MSTARLPTPPSGSEPLVATARDAVFVEETEARCDACGGVLPRSDDDDDYRVAGRGVYLWLRAGAVTFENAPLCASCASAIGMAALGRCEIEEEEG